MSMFENFPYTNLHELNLDWVINEINELKDGQVLSVNGQTGDVILYQAKDVIFPAVTETNWSLVRSTDGTTRGIMFGNDGRAYIVHGNSMEHIYSLNHQPPYPVTSVNGETGAVSLYTDNNGAIAFPTVVNPNIEGMIIGRSINGTPVYIQINTDGTAGIVGGEHSGEIYTTQDTDKNVFALEEAGSIETGTTNKEWGVVREVNSGNIGILFRLGETPEVYLRYQDEGFQVETLKLLTRDDIPSSSGVVSFNGQTGVVTADGNSLQLGNGDTRSIADAIDDIINDEYQMDNSITYTERGNTATQNIPLGKYVIWKNNPYISIANISSGDTLSSSNLLPLDHGIVDNLLQTVNTQANQINMLTNKLRATRYNLTGAATDITQNGHYIVDESTRTVRVYCSARSTSDIASNTVLGNIPAPYRPTTLTRLICLTVSNTQNIVSFFGEINTNGDIVQSVGQTIREVFMTGEYKY